MSNDPTNPDPSLEQLAAFLDGELDPAAGSRVEAWLADNPPAAAEIEGQRRVLRLWRANPPPEPSPAAWTAALSRVEAKLPAARSRPRRLPRTLWLSAGLAAAVLAAVFLTRLFPGGAPKAADDPLPVIAPGDVTIISMDARDAPGLVGAAPPVQEPILLASQDDVSVMDVKSYRDDGQTPLIGEGEVPMIVAASVAREGREP
jgi:hypothetical protein